MEEVEFEHGSQLRSASHFHCFAVNALCCQHYAVNNFLFVVNLHTIFGTFNAYRIVGVVRFVVGQNATQRKVAVQFHRNAQLTALVNLVHIVHQVVDESAVFVVVVAVALYSVDRVRAIQAQATTHTRIGNNIVHIVRENLLGQAIVFQETISCWVFIEETIDAAIGNAL